MSDLITKQTLPTFIDLTALTLAQLFTNSPMTVMNDKTRYAADITFVPVKLKPDEAEALEGLFNMCPFFAETKSEPEPQPNNLFTLKMSLFLTKCLYYGCCAVADEITGDSKRKTEADQLLNRMKSELEAQE